MQNRIFNLKLSIIQALTLSLFSPLTLNAAAPALADAPIGSISSVLPNIMFILDDSGSMEWRSIVRNGADGSGSYNATKFEFYSNAFNGVYYDPAQTYVVGLAANGDPMAVPDNSSTPTYSAVPLDIYRTPSVTRDISSNIAGDDYQWCASAPASPTFDVEDIDPGSVVMWSPKSGVPTTTSFTGCQNTPDATHTKAIAKRAFYYQWNGSGSAMTSSPFSNTISNFERIDIVPYNYIGGQLVAKTFPVKTRDGIATGEVRSYEQEMKNYATWWMYSSTRLNMMKTAVGRAFQKVAPKGSNPATVRVGYTTIHNNPTYSKNLVNAVGERIDNFEGTSLTQQIGAWYKKLYSQGTTGSTPLRTQLDLVGTLYTTGKYGSNAYSAATDPVQYSCQRNVAILSTDGYWNDAQFESNPIWTKGNQDVAEVDQWTNLAEGIPEGSGTNSYGYSLADVALYYYKNDLRSSMANNVPISGSDRAQHQHMNTYTIGLTSGSLAYSKTYETDLTGDFADIKTGAKVWPKPVKDTKTAVDDLWHAAVSGRGYGVVALNQKDVEDGLDRILARATAGIASGSGIGVASPVLSDSNKLVYRTKFDQGTWGGELEALEVDPVTGLPIGAPIWSASAKLDTLASGTGWNTSRYIFTRNGSGGTPFRWGNGTSNLTTTQQDNLKSATPGQTASEAQLLLNYLRGDTSNEGTLFRDRKGFNSTGSGILGDIANSEALVVGAPYRLYEEDQNKGYTAFKATSRIPMIYVGANDGMLHAFKAGQDSDSGVERWAYIPSLLIRSAADSGIGVLSYKETGNPPFQHRFFVNGQAYPNDIDFNNTGTHYNINTPSAYTPSWGTILVGGLGKGGKGYYALNVTNGYTASSEADAATKSLWEFTDSDMGYSYGRPTVIKTRQHGWVAIFTSGLNNTSGKGYIYVVNASNGSLIKKLATDAGDTTTPSNLMEVSVFESNNAQPYADQVYAGDMLGNVFRFDLRGDESTWQASRTKIAQFTDGTNAQPITTRPQIQIDSYTKQRWIFIGTGQYLHDDDRNDQKPMWNRIQTMYAFKDGDTSNPATFSAPISRNSSGMTAVTNTNTAGVTLPTQGWYMDMSGASGGDAAERIVVNPVAALDAIAWTTTIPTKDVCSSGASGKLYVRQFASARTLLKDLLNQDKAYESSVDGFVGLRLVKNKFGKVKIVATTPKGNIEIYLPNLTGSSLKQPRVSWRELIEN